MGFNGHGIRTELAACRVCRRPFRKHAPPSKRPKLFCSRQCWALSQRAYYELIRRHKFEAVLAILGRPE